MQYNKEDVNLAKQYKNNNLSTKTIMMLLNKHSNTKYTEKDIEFMLSYNPNNSKSSDKGKLYDMAASIVFNPEKRQRIKKILILLLAAFIIGMIALGIFVSWLPVIITVSSIIGLAIILYVVFYIMVKTGVLDKIIDKY